MPTTPAYRLKTILLLLLATAAGAASGEPYKNAIGWDSGISYIRRISPDLKVGVSVHDNTRRTQDDIQVSIIAMPAFGETDVYEGDQVLRIKLALYSHWFTYRSITMDRFIAVEPGYIHTKFKHYGEQLTLYAGCAPTYHINRHIMVSTQFGLYYKYMNESKWSHNYSYDLVTYEPRLSSIRKTGKKEIDFATFGTSLNINMALKCHFIF